jgi:hypothetical protein
MIGLVKNLGFFRGSPDRTIGGKLAGHQGATRRQRSGPMLREKAFRRATCVLVEAILALAAVSADSVADPKDYRFELVDKTVKAGAGALIQIRVINISTKNSVADADVRVNGLDMSPDGMAEMIAKATPMPSNNAAIHAFAADLAMPGRWALSLEAKVPGEPEPLRDKLLLRAQR